MQLARSIAIVPGLRFEPRVTSTNQLLADNYLELDDFSTLVAAEQTQGQGRSGRQWISEFEASLSTSLLLRPRNPEQAGLITLMVAASLHAALAQLYPSVGFSIKWPNDILVENRKLAGILAQLNPDGSVVVGFGINLRLPKSEIENVAAISEFSEPDFDLVLSECLLRIRENWTRLQSGDRHTLLQYIRNHCSTIGSKVRADLATGESIVGEAVEIQDDGRLTINSDWQYVVSAADVWHLRNS